MQSIASLLMPYCLVEATEVVKEVAQDIALLCIVLAVELV